jgi:hypothetical protein
MYNNSMDRSMLMIVDHATKGKVMEEHGIHNEFVPSASAVIVVTSSVRLIRILTLT